jgi:glycosyltransferase involved in cell wall biosynthesis
VLKNEFFRIDYLSLKLKPKLLFFVTEDWYFCSHRLALAMAAIKDGFEVVVATKVCAHGEMIRQAGIRLIPFFISRSGVNPIFDLISICRLIKLYRRETPQIVHHVALKPVMYGSIAARLAGIQGVVNALAGMGYIFSSDTSQTRLMRPGIEMGLRLLLGNSRMRLIVQNPDDYNFVVQRHISKRKLLRLVPGSGVDIARFIPTQEPAGIPVVALVSRLLWDKGVGEFVEASKILQHRGIKAKFVLVGKIDSENPRAISEKQIKEWVQEGTVEYWGDRSDMPFVYSQTHIVCLPSYREGLPKVLLEAAACGRPLVATDVPGCREVVRDGENGYLVLPRNPNNLSETLLRLVINKDLRQRFGSNARAHILASFADYRIAKEVLSIYHELIS